MPRDYKVYLEDILDAAARARRYVQGHTMESFERDDKTLDAVVRNLVVIGEAVKGVPEDVRSRRSDIEWRRIAGLRDVLIHRYFGLNAEVVWDIVQTRLAGLESAVRELLAE